MAYADPDRPKNDKATILGDSLTVLHELRGVVGQLRAENKTLREEAKEVRQGPCWCPLGPCASASLAPHTWVPAPLAWGQSVSLRRKREDVLKA